ncbi:hypothetical protein BDV26DRAFT_291466 [Aspergillus bertholletiae]|uniref:Uncharacterized protein n=1 Tax=Aspergillus bertholletiae TaxID=1226010 RepID=A0A5N7BC16_9EURO|nr:hypothetical protein BDV26DRAFT_291466 [Aspergillus bertholletiae]
MARLCVPGFIFRRDRPSARFTTQPAFRSFPCSVSYRANPPVSPRPFLPVTKPGVHSFSATSTSSTGDRSFSQMSQGSHLPVRSVRAPAPRSTTTPARTGVVAALKTVSSRLAERRATRQARPRPWAQPTSTAAGNPSSAHCKPAPAKPALRQPTKPAGSAGTRGNHAQRAIARVGNAVRELVKSPPKAKPAKRVRFGETTVVTVSRWIDRSEHSFIFPSWFGHLQGWRVFALSEPNEDGETEKYVSQWGSDPYDMLHTHYQATRPCGREGCVWGIIRDLMYRHPTWTPEMAIKGFNRWREIMRGRGKFYL